ncbi:MAG: hypothetical protein IMZ69_03775 [Spirochaetes bacterium]|nr:hypothetical protein [Spirochaetota bacterium]
MGNNSAANQAVLDQSAYHFVGSLSPVQHPDLLAVPRSRFRRLTRDDLSGVEVWRTEKTVLGATRTLVVTYCPALSTTQRATILREMHKATGRLHALQRHLAIPPRRGRPRTVASVDREVAEILHARHLKDLVRTTVTPRHDRIELHYRLDDTAWRRLLWAGLVHLRPMPACPAA